ncbi:glycoside hydrolase family 31 protein [Arcanobacterium phocae]|uniref:glycoside hydrolase family 31 protein n=1 Tax=Arcanobacterium phocae TaxID=131112 RepID=UPI001C0EC9BC|nr:TIM-barrel domain-containing protein [Arcanobacterium phocae]
MIQESHNYPILAGETWRATILSPYCVRFEVDGSGAFVDELTQLVEQRVVASCDGCSIYWDASEGKESTLIIETPIAYIYYDMMRSIPDALTVHFKDSQETTNVRWPSEDPQNLRGTCRTLDNIDGACPLEPGLISTSGYVLVSDAHSVLRTNDGWIERRNSSQDAQDVYLFVYGHDYHKLFNSFFALTGISPLIPRAMLGNWWSRFWPYSDKEYRQLLDTFEHHNIPLSVGILDMDWHITQVPPEIGSGWTGYTWNRELFPDPAEFLAHLHDRGMLTSLNVHPADGVRCHEEAYEEMCRELDLDPNGQSVDFDPVDPTFMKAYFKVLHKPLEEQGVDFWWIDWQQGERTNIPEVDPLWMLNHYHYLNSSTSRSNRKVIFSRYAGLGSHRYPVGFSGDAITSWESLSFQPYFTANAANVGFYWWSHDIGGHMGGIRNNELHTRWVQYGVFSPIMRLHATASPFTRKEPWVFPQPYCQTQIAFLQLRHRLMPYLYTAMWQSLRGQAPVRPLYHDYQTVAEAYQFPNEYLFGDSMLVVPIVEPASLESHYASATGWLPAGLWFDFFTGDRYQGEQKVTFFRDITTYPVLVKAGSVIPLASDTGEAILNHPDHLTLRVFLGTGQSELIEDDGDDTPQKYLISQCFDNDSLQISCEVNEKVFSRVAYVELQLMGVESCSVDGTDEEYYYRIDLGKCDLARMIVDISDIKLKQPDIRHAIFQLIDQAEGPLTDKEQLWDRTLRFIDNIESETDDETDYKDNLPDSQLQRVVAEKLQCYRLLNHNFR